MDTFSQGQEHFYYESMMNQTSIFQNSIKKSHFNFCQDPSAFDIQSLQASHGKATFSVLTTGSIPQSPGSSSQHPPGGGSGSSGGSAPPSSSQPRSVQFSQPSQGSQEQSSGGFSLRKLTQKMKSLIIKPKFLPKFPGMAALVISLSLIARSGEAADSSPLMTTHFPNNLPWNARNATKALKTGSCSTDSHSLPAVPAWVPSSSTAATLMRKRSKPVCNLFSLNVLGAVLAMLAEPGYLEKCNALLGADDPDSKALLSLQLCDSY
jgi:hypothetical protein